MILSETKKLAEVFREFKLGTTAINEILRTITNPSFDTTALAPSAYIMHTCEDSILPDLVASLLFIINFTLEYGTTITGINTLDTILSQTRRCFG
jgi:hypothetical protein